MTTTHFRYQGLAGAVLLALCIPSFAAASHSESAGNVPYVTGGVGLDESTRMIADRSHYPLAVEIYEREGGHDLYTAGAKVVVRDEDGHEVLDTVAKGPFVFADVPAGHYAVEVTNDGRTERRRLDVRDGATARAIFVFDAA